MLLLCGIDKLWFRYTLMPSPRVLLRLLLILVLCTDGIFAAWASTRMAVNELGRTGYSGVSHHGAGSAGQARARAEKQLAKARAETRPGAQLATATRGKAAQGAPAAPLDHHDDCDCSNVSGCACSCMLTFFPGRNAPLFAAQHTLASVYLAPPLLPPARRQISRLFRPPIA